jgi:hypothetical protein
LRNRCDRDVECYRVSVTWRIEMDVAWGEQSPASAVSIAA